MKTENEVRSKVFEIIRDEQMPEIYREGLLAALRWTSGEDKELTMRPFSSQPQPPPLG